MDKGKNQGNAPIDVLRDGNLKASIWENEGEKGVYHTTVFAKTYEDRDGNLQDTHSFNSGDLLRISELARESYRRTNELRREVAQEHSQDREPERRSGRRAQFQDRRTETGSGGRSQTPRRSSGQLSDKFLPSL